MGYYCNICKKDITREEFFYSKKNFGRPLCREHQVLESRTQEGTFRFSSVGSDAKETINSDERSADEASKSGWKSSGMKAAVKIGKGVKKRVKKIADSSRERHQIRKWKESILRRMTMSQLKTLCFENKISTSKTIVYDDEESDYYLKKIEFSQDQLVSRLRRRVPLDALISFTKRNTIDINEILVDRDRKKAEEFTEKVDEKAWFIAESGKKKDLRPEYCWRIEVLTRDNFKCRVCGKPCNSAHHIYSRKYCQKHAPGLEWDIKNGIAACYECHKKITIDGRKWFQENDRIF